MKIDHGLFRLDFTDHHAILGIPVNADPKAIRKRYLRIARRLHPDSCLKETEEGKKWASELLSKLVNPAYEKLSQERDFTEYKVMLKLKGQQLRKQQETLQLATEPAQKLASTAGDVDPAYNAAVQDLAKTQYKSLEQVLDIIGKISELNLVYLMRQSDLGTSSSSSSPASGQAAIPSTGTTADASQGQTQAPRQPVKRENVFERYLHRAQDLERQKDYNRAVVELREALKMKPNSALAHSRLGVVYLKANQNTMAKVHFRKALQIDPNDPTAKAGLLRLDPKNQESSASSGKASKTGKAAATSSTKSRGGLFGRFGGKKK